MSWANAKQMPLVVNLVFPVAMRAGVGDGLDMSSWTAQMMLMQQDDRVQSCMEQCSGDDGDDAFPLGHSEKDEEVLLFTASALADRYVLVTFPLDVTPPWSYFVV